MISIIEQIFENSKSIRQYNEIEKEIKKRNCDCFEFGYDLKWAEHICRSWIEKHIKELASYVCEKYPPICDGDFDGKSYIYAEDLDMIVEYTYSNNHKSKKTPEEFECIRFFKKSKTFATNDIIVKNILSFLHSIKDREFYAQNESFRTAVTKMHKLHNGIVEINNNLVPINSFFNYEQWLTKTRLSEFYEKQSIERIASYKCSDVSFSDCGSCEFIPRVKVVLEEVDDVQVIRWVAKYQDDVFDYQQAFITGRKITIYKKCDYGNWNQLSDIEKKDVIWHKKHVDAVDFKDVSNTHIMNCVNKLKQMNCHACEAVSILMAYIVNERIEQFVKVGLLRDTMYFCNVRQKGTITQIIDNVVKGNKNETSLYKYLGINKYQFTKIKAVCDNVMEFKGFNFFELTGILKQMACGSSAFSVADLDCETSDKLIDIAIDVLKQSESLSYLFIAERFYKICGTEQKRQLYSYLQILNKIDRTNNYGASKLYSDLLRMLESIGTTYDAMLFPKTYDEIKLKHNEMVSLFNIIEQEKKEREEKEQESRFSKSVEKFKDLEFDEDGNDFVVMIPKSAIDLINEGLALRHCVGSYVSEVINGKTNIVFIRRKDSIDKSFFTIEVNQDIIRQAYGFGNCNVDTVDGLMDFIKIWAKKKGLSIGNINQRR